MSEPAPRILVEGGPVHRRVNHTLAALIGFIIGVLPTMGLVAIEAFSVERKARAADCREIEVVKQGLSETLREAQQFAASSPVRTAAEKQATVTFYRDALRRLSPRHC